MPRRSHWKTSLLRRKCSKSGKQHLLSTVTLLLLFWVVSQYLRHFSECISLFACFISICDCRTFKNRHFVAPVAELIDLSLNVLKKNIVSQKYESSGEEQTKNPALEIQISPPVRLYFRKLMSLERKDIFSAHDMKRQFGSLNSLTW